MWLNFVGWSYVLILLYIGARFSAYRVWDVMAAIMFALFVGEGKHNSATRVPWIDGTPFSAKNCFIIRPAQNKRRSWTE